MNPAMYTAIYIAYIFLQVCTFCYHSVMVQWTRFNDSKVMDQAARKYNLNDYNCYVCGVTTYRKRIRALRVQVSC